MARGVLAALHWPPWALHDSVLGRGGRKGGPTGPRGEGDMSPRHLHVNSGLGYGKLVLSPSPCVRQALK